MTTVGLIIIKNKRILLAYSNNKKCFYLPGGKVEGQENNFQALFREIREELNCFLNKNLIEYYTHISVPAFGERQGIIMEQDCYLLKGMLEPKPSAEINELRFFSLGEYLRETIQAPGAVLVLQKLKSESLID
jgi:ADP-ribose pyrophosphatase YjhB (NUDIX family)